MNPIQTGTEMPSRSQATQEKNSAGHPQRNALRQSLMWLTGVILGLAGLSWGDVLLRPATSQFGPVYAGMLERHPDQTVPQPTPTIDALSVLPMVTPTFTPQPNPDNPKPIEESTPTPVPSFALTFQMSFRPEFPVSGDELRIEYLLTNPAEETAFHGTLRNLLPADLSLIEGESENSELSTEIDSSGLVLLFHWNELGPAEVAKATIVVQLADDIPAGTVIDNLAVVFADNAHPTSAGISIGLPPAHLPTFKR